MQKSNKICCIVLLLVLCCLVFVACGEDKRTVHYVVDDDVYEVIELEGNSTVIPSAHPQKHGYVFDGWYLDKDIWQNPVTADTNANTIAHDSKIYAKWKPQQYAINYNVNGGINSPDNPHSYTIESKDIVLQTPTKHNALFVGWFENDKQVTNIPQGSTGDRQFVAKWLDYDYMVDYDAQKTAAQNGDMLENIINTAPDNSVILIDKGDYAISHALSIDKSLTLIGKGYEQSVISLNKDVGTMFLTIAGGGNNFELHNVHIKGYEDISHNNSSALRVGTSDQPNVGGNVVVANCKFSGFTKNSITVAGGRATITDTQIIVFEFVGAAGNGIQIDMDAEATIVGNDISCAISDAERWQSGGLIVLRGGKATTVRDNIFTRCNVAVMLETYYDTPQHDTQVDEQAESRNTFIDCHWDVYRRAKS